MPAYAIIFDDPNGNLRDSDKICLIENILVDKYAFIKHNTNMYCKENGDQVKVILAVAELAQKYDWFRDSVKNVKMWRIEEQTDLMPIIEKYKQN